MNTLELKIKRFKTPDYCIGKLSVDGKYFCDTLEDTDRGLKSTDDPLYIKGIKKSGVTAIPTGTYIVDMNTKSPKYSDFNRYKWAQQYDGRLPRLLKVPEFDGILIHVGNYPKDTEGCILVGRNAVKGAVMESTATFVRLMDDILLKARADGKVIRLTIE